MNLLVIVLSSQLLYYLLIAQTGVVGAFDSDIKELFTLPIGGVVGSLLSAYWRHLGIKTELCFLFGIQVMLSWFYPNYSLGVLLVLGFVVGYTTPLLLYLFGTQSKRQLAFGLAISYTVGTALYTYPFALRGDIAIFLPLISIVALRFSPLPSEIRPCEKRLDGRIVAMMMVWIFTDSALFETLSRSEGMDIWSDYTGLIIVSHLVGVYLAYRYGENLKRQGWIIWALFVISYALYYMHYPPGLAVVYPIVISYYNVLLFRTLIAMHNIRHIAIAMVGVGWVAASAANAVALYHQLWIAVAVLAVYILIYSSNFRRVS
ncbi:MAG: hypothetical protein M0P91_00065 [Sulfuricurvum sp.]|jgi:hypothetical protein|uniref:hypothetical protein n=1 Tax=Sulfuricurvum sp. TaxID=2025608 RepID=UPI0025EC995E|nr:hypothetical protein [Sulfuricurvum sp.]MCK9371568.1 hypothetical protein [Sulfuricurvum sp.]